MTADQTPGNSISKREESADQPPFFRSWSTIYTLVLSFLALLIVLFYVFMKVYS